MKVIWCYLLTLTFPQDIPQEIQHNFFLKSYMHLEDTNLYTGFCIRWRLHSTFSLSETPFQFGEIFKVTMIFKWTNSYCFTRPVILGVSFHCGMCLGSFPEDLILMLTKDSKIEKKKLSVLCCRDSSWQNPVRH